MTDYVAGGVPEPLVPRTTEARNAREAALAAGRRRGPSVAVWGMAMVVASEATLFGTFIGSYYYLRFGSVHWPPPGTPEPRVVVPLIMVAILATTSLPMQLAANAARRGRLWRTRLLLVWALAVQCIYLAWAIHDYVQQLHVSQPQDNAYSSIYYTLLGADHVARRGRDPSRRLAAREARARPDDVPAQRGAGRRLLLARRQPPDPDRARGPAERDAVNEARDIVPARRETLLAPSPRERVGRFTLRRLSVVQWIGVVVAPLAWTGQHVVGYGVGEARCSVGGLRWGIGYDTWELAILADGGPARPRLRSCRRDGLPRDA